MFTVKLLTSQTDKRATFEVMGNRAYAFNAFFAVQDESGSFIFMHDTSYEVYWFMVRNFSKSDKHQYGEDTVDVWYIESREDVNKAIATAFNKSMIAGMRYPK